MSDPISLREHLEALRFSDLRFLDERDRRYMEIGVEREKALKIKETADLAALSLAREIQTYKDEKANELREQINRERVIYATKDDLQSLTREIKVELSGLREYVTDARGRTKGIGLVVGGLATGVFILLAFAGLVIRGFWY